jgi:putative membrane protein
MDRSMIYGLAGCLLVMVGCAKDTASSAPEPAASQGSEATPEPGVQNQAQTAPPEPAAAAVEPVQPAAPPPPIAAPDTALSDGQVIGIVQALNAGEIEQAQLAKTKAKDAKVKKFATQMITQHGEGQQKAAQLGKGETLAPADSSVASDLKVASNADMDMLKNANAADFDTMYMANQVKQHDAALQMLTNRLIPAATDPKLKAFLESTRATVEKHLKSANEIQQTLLSSNAAK